MSEEHMTREQVKELVESVVENVGLKFTQVVSEKFEEYGDKQKNEQKLARESTFEQGTGFPWDERGKVKVALNYSYAAQKNSMLWKAAGVVALTSVVVKTFWADIFNG